MATFNGFDSAVEYLMDGTIDLDGDTFKLYLSNAAPNAGTHTVKADIAGITEQNGYAEVTLTLTWTEISAGAGYRLANNADVTITASTGSFGPFQYVLIYDDTPTSPADPLLNWWDNGTPATITDGNSFVVDLDANFAIFTADWA